MKHFTHLRFCLVLVVALACSMAQAQELFDKTKQPNSLPLVASGFSICTDAKDFALVQRSAALLQQDIKQVTNAAFPITHQPQGNIILIGTIGQSSFIKELVQKKKLNVSAIQGKWEAYTIATIANPFKGVKNAIVIAGSDRRGAAYGMAEFCSQMGVSPWYWWADVPVTQKKELYLNRSFTKTDAPKVKYRGIFINDEAPALAGWTREKFGGFNSQFYEKVFELLIRLKANYLWPAMWGNAFYDDDSLSIKKADEYGIVIGTSHHEPLMRAHVEWQRYGKGKWDYAVNADTLKQFWTKGMQRAWNEKIVSIGMRGDGDEPMTRETAVALLEKIVADQRAIIENVTQKPAKETPQLWALYKEVQDYYDKGMRVPDDVTLLLCDDNWGNLRKLPKPGDKKRSGGYGIYYHFDYVGGPRNYKWLNTNPIARVWEQMHLAWEYDVRQIWIVNVGDIKPMEFPISFFLDYAWNPEAIQADELQRYTEQWAAQQFGSIHAKAIAEIISKYTKYNGRRKPELLDANTYSLLNYDEANRVTNDWIKLAQQAETIHQQLPEETKDAYFQLVLHPVIACANLQEMYTAVAKNRYEASRQSVDANAYADQAKNLYANDSIITARYHALRNGKWNHMMDQTHIGYTNWQQPRRQTMPVVQRVEAGTAVHQIAAPDTSSGKYISIEADHFTKAVNTKGITWTILPDHGKTGSAVTPFPVTAAPQKPGGQAPHLQYEVTIPDTGTFTLHAYFSPTLNIHQTEEGLLYGISIDDETPQVISLNKEDRNSITGIWNVWVANNIIIKKSNHIIRTPGKHTIKYWMVHPAVVLQKLVFDLGDLKPSYLGPPGTR